jgi:hypothetical protein
MDLTLSIGGVAEGLLIQDSLRELLADLTGFFQGIPPRAGQRHDLRAMHQAQTLVGHHLGLLFAPARQLVRPLARTPELVHSRQNAIVLQ